MEHHQLRLCWDSRRFLVPDGGKTFPSCGNPNPEGQRGHKPGCGGKGESSRDEHLGTGRCPWVLWHEGMEGDELVPTQEPPFPSGICAWGREREKLEGTTRTGGLAKEIPWICPTKPLGETFLEGLSPSFHGESGKGFFPEIRILISMSFQSENQTCSGVSFGGNGSCSHP